MTEAAPREKSIIFLSYPLAVDSPMYGKREGLSFERTRTMKAGDSNNESRFAMPAHLGTHVDAPLHFVEGGRAVDAFAAHELVYARVSVVDVPLETGRLFTAQDFQGKGQPDTDLVLIRTGFSKHRPSDPYILDGPGFDKESAAALLSEWPKVRAVGVDAISFTRPAARVEGREAHQMLLGQDLLLVEDLDFSSLPKDRSLQTVWIAPLRLAGGDGAPCTVLAALKPCVQGVVGLTLSE